MTDQQQSEALDLIHQIATVAVSKCSDPIPHILEEALDEIEQLSRYKGAHGNLISKDRRQLFDLD